MCVHRKCLGEAVTDLMEKDTALRATMRALVDAEEAADRLFTALQQCAERQHCCRGDIRHPEGLATDPEHQAAMCDHRAAHEAAGAALRAYIDHGDYH